MIYMGYRPRSALVTFMSQSCEACLMESVSLKLEKTKNYDWMAINKKGSE